MHSSNPQLTEPHSKLEAWKYSKVESFLKLKHTEHQADSVSALQDIPAEVLQLLGKGGERVVFYNGQLVSSLTDVKLDKVSASELVPQNYFESLNFSQFQDGLNLEIKQDSRKLNLVYLYGNRIEGETHPARMTTLNRIRISSKSSVEIFEVHIALNDLEFSLNQSTHIEISGDSKLERVKCFWLGDDSYAYDLEKVEIKDSSSFRNLVVQTGGKWSRLEQSAKLLSEGGHYSSLGAYLLADKGHCDFTTNIEHIVGHTSSEQLYKGVLSDQSRAAFSGRIVIHQDAQKSATAQLNQNVILGDRAEADSKPQLEVYADDVTASHGSTIGGLNADEIFYLQSRGLGKEVATEMVAKAFVIDLAERLESEELRSKVGLILEKGFSRYVQGALNA